jgi:hypothetical protein
MSPFPRATYPAGLIALVVCGSFQSPASGTTYDTRPRESILLEDSARFVAQDGMDSVALYQVADGSVVHRFPAPAYVKRIALSPDEKHLLVACKDGSLVLWRVATGERLWQKNPGESGVRYVWDASFSVSGERFVVCDYQDRAVVFDTRTGGQVGAVSFPPGRTHVMSAALGSDGSRGFMIDLGDRLHRFDLADGRPVDTGLRGGWPVRYSSDGKVIAFRSNNSGSAERLSVARVGDPLTRQDLGDFSHIGHIRPARDGSFLITARVVRREEFALRYVGVQVWPEGGRTQTFWEIDTHLGVSLRTDFSPRSMIGVSTDVGLVTRIVDLRTNKVSQVIDNGANYRPEILSTSSVGVAPREGLPPWLGWVGGAGLIVLLGGILIWRRRPEH